MTINLDKFSFPQWIDFVFNHPVEEKEWYWQTAWQYHTGYALMLEYMLRLFRNPAFLLEQYDPKQIEQGFWFLLKPGGLIEKGLLDINVAWSLRHECVISMGDLFEKLYSVNPLEDSSCYMWWDLVIGGYFGMFHTSWHPLVVEEKDVQIHRAFFETLRQILSLESRECQKSALHGLSHLNHPSGQETIKNFLDEHPAINQDLREYAIKCMAGEVQ